MDIKNLSQMKKAIGAKRCFEIVEHYFHPEMTGQIREPSVIQTNAFYSVVKDEPEHKVSKANDGKGYYLAYGKAADWKFENGECVLYDRLANPVWRIRFLEA